MATTDPFEALADTGLPAEVNATVRALLADAVNEMRALYRLDGPLPRDTETAEIAAAIGTTMLRLVELGQDLTGKLGTAMPAVKVRGDLAIMTARTAGYLVRDVGPTILSRLLPHLVRELRECAGAPDGPPGPMDADPDLPLIPLRTSACNITLVGEGCFDLPAHKGDGFISTWWKFSPEALAAINAGIPFKLTLHTDGWPPARLEVDAL